MGVSINNLHLNRIHTDSSGGFVDNVVVDMTISGVSDDLRIPDIEQYLEWAFAWLGHQST